jgi:CubicO group peptidase (beta-lactamase class C family)
VTLILNRRHFMGASALTAGLAGAPAFAKMPLAPKAAPWSPVTAAMQGFVDKKYVPGAAAAIGRGTAEADFLFSGALAFDNPAAVTADSLFRCYSMTKPITGMAAMMPVSYTHLRAHETG